MNIQLILLSEAWLLVLRPTDNLDYNAFSIDTTRVYRRNVGQKNINGKTICKEVVVALNRSTIPRYPLNMVSRDTSVGISTGNGLDDRVVGVRVPVGVKNFLFSMSSRRALGPKSLLSSGYRKLFPRG
jgi:hypothetical protein